MSSQQWLKVSRLLLKWKLLPALESYYFVMLILKLVKVSFINQEYQEYQWWIELVNRRAGAGAGQGEGGVQHVTTENE